MDQLEKSIKLYLTQVLHVMGILINKDPRMPLELNTYILNWAKSGKF
jgi:hypothetical protein